MPVPTYKEELKQWRKYADGTPSLFGDIVTDVDQPKRQLRVVSYWPWGGAEMAVEGKNGGSRVISNCCFLRLVRRATPEETAAHLDKDWS